ncbi:hypothetical protein AaE_015475 [Aphanomyces astaci]|uniref:Uncharacterized protein n=1 Tax=Aphanomyces astaci TaxID=112090 RepID=A0A6A4Z173_APHAT|nr:hypothetical protein AaE_015475 [Aphanomyces astaci]
MTQCGRLHEGVKVADGSAGLSALLEEPNLRSLTGSGWERKAVAQDGQHSLHRQWCTVTIQPPPAAVQAAEDVEMGFDDAVKVAVQFDPKILDADNRVSRMLDNLMKTLEADGQEWVLHQEGKLVVGIITKAIKPAPLQLAVTKQLQLQRNRVLKSDVFRYVKWLRQFAIGYQLYGGMDEEKPSQPAAEEPLKESSRPRPRFSPVREEKQPSGASVAPPTWRADKRDEPPERPKP